MKTRLGYLIGAASATAFMLIADATIVTTGAPTWSAGNLLFAQTRAREEQAFLEARRAINGEEFERAAELFEALRDPSNHTSGRYTADSYYWEAFARYRLGDLAEALVLLEALEGGYPEAHEDRYGNKGRLHDEVVNLRLRIRREQAEQGDPRAAEEVLAQSEALLHPELLRRYADSLQQARSDLARREYNRALAAQQARSDSARREYATALEAQRARSDLARREYNRALVAQQARSDSARVEYAAALEAQRVRADSARREYAAAMETQRSRADSARRDYTGILQAQQSRADSARREYTGTLQRYRSRSIPAARAAPDTVVVADTMAELPSVSAGFTRPADSTVVGPAFAEVTDPVTAEVTDVVAAMAYLTTDGRVSQVQEDCENISVQQAALTALLRLETERMPSVRSVLERQDACSVHLRRQAVDWLARQRTNEAQSELIELAENHPARGTREAAIRGLWRFPNVTAVHALSRFLTTSDDSDRLLQQTAIESLRRSALDEASQALVAFARNPSEPLELRQAALTAYGRRSDVTTEELMQLHGESSLQGLEAAILENLGRRVQTGEEGVANWLFERAMDKQRPIEIRTAALAAWSRAPSVDLEHLARSYGELEEPDLKERIFYALYRRALSDEAAAPAVVDKMIELARGEEDREIRETAVQWIGRTGSERAVEFLLELLRERPGRPPGQGLGLRAL